MEGLERFFQIQSSIAYPASDDTLQ